LLAVLVVDPIKRREECRDYCDYHCNTEKQHGGTVAIPLLTHEDLHYVAMRSVRLR
jgi:hypothetical protein